MKGLIFRGFLVTNSAFRNELGHNERVALAVKYRYAVKRLQERADVLVAECHAMVGEKDQGRFSLEVTIRGEFLKTVECEAEPAAVQRAMFEALYPYLRTYIFNLTANAGMPPLTLPVAPAPPQAPKAQNVGQGELLQ